MNSVNGVLSPIILVCSEVFEILAGAWNSSLMLLSKALAWCRTSLCITTASSNGSAWSHIAADLCIVDSSVVSFQKDQAYKCLC